MKTEIPSNLKIKSLPIARCAFKVLSDEGEGICEMIVSVYNNVDSYGERMILGCYAKSLSQRNPTGLFSHNWELPVAKTLEAKELKPNDPLLPEEIKGNGGLYIKAQYNLETERGSAAFSDIKAGIINEFSVGYEELDATWNDSLKCKDVTEVFLFEWSSVVAGANPSTAVISAKSLGKNVGLQVFTRVKSQFLGENAECCMTYSALCDLGYTLLWDVLHECCYGTSMSKADRIAMCQFAIQEYGELCAKTMQALLPEENAAPPVGGGILAELQAHESLVIDTTSLRFRDGTEFKTALDALSELGKRVKSELSVIAELRAKDRRKEGREFSTANESKLTEHISCLREQADMIENMLKGIDDSIVTLPEETIDYTSLRRRSQQLLLNNNV